MNIRAKYISVKDYAAEHHVSAQSVYAKIRRRKNELDGHTFKRGGATFLDGYAQELLKPAEGNSMLANKNDGLKNALAKANVETEKYKSEAEKNKAESERYKTAAESLSQDYMKVCGELDEAKAEIKRLLEINGCLEKADRIFDALSDPKNAGLVRKLGIFGSKPVDSKNV